MQEAVTGGHFFRDDLLLTSIRGPGPGLPQAVFPHRRHPFVRVAAPRPGEAREIPATMRAKLQA